MTHDQERGKFEAWAAANTDITLTKFNGEYNSFEAENAWKAWQAAKREPVVSGEANDPEGKFEHFIATAIANSPEPLRQLGEYLSRVMDEDQFKTAERFILQLATTHPPEAMAKDAERYRELLEAAKLAVCRPQAVNALAYQRLHKAIAAITTPRGG